MIILPDEIRQKYPYLPEHDIYSAIELAAIKTASTIYSAPAVAYMDEEELMVQVYRAKGPQKISLRKLKRASKRLLLEQIENQLSQKQALQEHNKYKTLQNKYVTGRIESISRDGNLGIFLELSNAYNTYELYGICPLHQQPRKEKWNYTAGSTKSFLITSCLPVTNGKTSKLRLVASRVAQELPSLMLSKLSGISGIKCIKRAPGLYSRITTLERIPKSFINTVGKELGEHIDVTWLR